MIVRTGPSPAAIRCISCLNDSPFSCCRSFWRRRLEKTTAREDSMLARILAVALAAVFFNTAHVRADDYPSSPVTIIVPYPAGGPTDQAARQVAGALSTMLKQNFIVENVSGGGTIIATHKVAQAAPDGYRSEEHT